VTTQSVRSEPVPFLHTGMLKDTVYGNNPCTKNEQTESILNAVLQFHLQNLGM